ncbi:hypothetical protein DXG01_017023 [Tephrocybe rancida]|nr:hypothetical protein DXG01_017023 [Tephrocybe rancida]
MLHNMYITPVATDRNRKKIGHNPVGLQLVATDHGMKKDEEFLAGLLREEREEVAAQDAGWWRFGLSLLSTIEELKALGLIQE